MFEALEKTVVVLDTNVLISGLLSPHGTAAQVIIKFRERRFDVVTSKKQILELRNVLRRPNIIKAFPEGITAKDILDFLLKLKKIVKIYNPPPAKWNFKDERDHFLLDLVACSKADFLVTGDKELQALSKIEKCLILSPQAFIRHLEN